MSNKEILERAIQKAIDGGWNNVLNYVAVQVMKHTFAFVDKHMPIRYHSNVHTLCYRRTP